MVDKEKATILEFEKCNIEINNDGIISLSNCPDIELCEMDIDMLKKVKDIVKET